MAVKSKLTNESVMLMYLTPSPTSKRRYSLLESPWQSIYVPGGSIGHI
ncbi:hypothetical protein [Thermococcus sp.]|nr:hypothetical protein [Thermococcus sp.]